MTSECVIVLGMHRSGTSALTGCLNILGIELGEGLLPAHPSDNAKGYWESQLVNELNDELFTALGRSWDDERLLPPEWVSGEATLGIQQRIRAYLIEQFSESPLWGLKDPRLCRLLPAWLPSIQSIAEVKIVLAVRNPQEVAKSMEKSRRIHRERACLLWLLHLLEAEHATRMLPRTVVHYDALIRDWRSALSTLPLDIDVNLPLASPDVEKQLDQFVTGGLKRFSATGLEGATELSDLAEELYGLFLADSTASAWEKFDGVRARTVALAKVVAPWVEVNQELVRRLRAPRPRRTLRQRFERMLSKL